MPQMLIGGEQRAAAAELEVVNPATEEVVDTVPAGTADDVNSAVEAAKRAFPEWSKTDVEKRAGLLGKVADLIQDNAKELAALLTAEQGKPIAEAGVPDGVLNVVTGRGSEIGDALVSHPDVRRVAFTGSTEVGKHVASLAVPDLKRVTLELGGSDPVIVCEDADVEAAVKAVIIGRYWNAGQACLGCKRVYVHESVYDDFVGQLVERVGRYEPGDGTVKAEKPKLRMGPIHTERGRDELLEQIEDGGGEVLIGGGTGDNERGWFLEPAVIAEPRDDSRLVREEVFGPVLPVFRYSDFDDAIRRANDTRYGLGSSIWTHDVRKIHRAGQDIDAGMTWVNQIHYGYDELPFGGMKDSGFGKEHGLEALDHYVELKSVVVGGLG